MKKLANAIETFLSCRLIPLDKNPGLRPIGAGKVLRRSVGKVIVSNLRDEIIKSARPLHESAGQESGCKVPVHAAHKMHEEEHTEAILLVDAVNTFNSVNRKVFLHSINVACPSITFMCRTVHPVYLSLERQR